MTHWDNFFHRRGLWAQFGVTTWENSLNFNGKSSCRPAIGHATDGPIIGESNKIRKKAARNRHANEPGISLLYKWIEFSRFANRLWD